MPKTATVPKSEVAISRRVVNPGRRFHPLPSPVDHIIAEQSGGEITLENPARSWKHEKRQAEHDTGNKLASRVEFDEKGGPVWHATKAISANGGRL